MPITTTVAFVGKDDDDDDDNDEDVETNGDDKMIKSFPSRPLLPILPGNLCIHTPQKVLKNQFYIHATSFSIQLHFSFLNIEKHTNMHHYYLTKIYCSITCMHAFSSRELCAICNLY